MAEGPWPVASSVSLEDTPGTPLLYEVTRTGPAPVVDFGIACGSRSPRSMGWYPALTCNRPAGHGPHHAHRRPSDATLVAEWRDWRGYARPGPDWWRP